jgi:hypothetical protein
MLGLVGKGPLANRYWKVMLKFCPNQHSGWWYSYFKKLQILHIAANLQYVSYPVWRSRIIFMRLQLREYFWMRLLLLPYCMYSRPTFRKQTKANLRIRSISLFDFWMIEIVTKERGHYYMCYTYVTVFSLHEHFLTLSAQLRKTSLFKGTKCKNPFFYFRPSLLCYLLF